MRETYARGRCLCGCTRDRRSDESEALCRLGPLALRGRLGSGFVRSIACACYRTVAQIKRHTRVQKIQEIRISNARNHFEHVLGSYPASPPQSQTGIGRFQLDVAATACAPLCARVARTQPPEPIDILPVNAEELENRCSCLKFG